MSIFNCSCKKTEPEKQSIRSETKSKLVLRSTNLNEPVSEIKKVKTNRTVVYYFNGDYRCRTCINMEKYALQALQQGFEKEMTNGELEWKPVNFDKPESKHFKKDYNLYTKAIIISAYNEGKEIRWKNCDKIWDLVNDPKQYIQYVQNEIQSFLKGK